MFDTSNVVDMHDMFSGCYSLTNIDLSNFNTSNVTIMSGMFYSNKSLESLNLCSFDTLNVTNMNVMFTNSLNLKTIYVSDKWNMENASTSNMFDGAGVSSVTTGKCG